VEVFVTTERIMNAMESSTNTKPNGGLDRTTVWIIWSGLALVVIGAGIGSAAFLAGPAFAFGSGELWYWVGTGGAVLCAIGGWRAARRWSATGRKGL
jgi:hypothetical protein